MNAAWTQFLAAQSAVTGPAAAASPATELQQIRDGCVLCALDSEGLIEASGPDAETFLHAQLSSDVRALREDRAQLSTYNSPKGRVLATLLLWRSREGFLLQSAADLAEALRKRLSMYVLRSKVQLVDAQDRYVRIGLAGSKAAHMLRAAGLLPPEHDFELVAFADDGPGGVKSQWLLRLPGSRYQLVAAPERAVALWQALASHGASPGTGAAWRWLAIRSGIAQVTAATQDELVVQMLNYDLLGAVSFSKGCYPGQEIVARAQYRGSIKRRTLLLHVDAAQAPAAGQAIHADSADSQSAGTVLNAAAAPDGGFDLLACLHLDLALGRELRLGAADGPVLAMLELPYALPAGR